ncbi:META domain-containing protein [Thalassotalea ponticola]|uniref:META domain-containing protein n=1 Tax=Thalassotalea ponticola TaxID=1523392 RepID=UPI0025B41E7C|nr:META domain-containing protein [Thalassotalea ponticola]MDN3652816.1 META domain-containing protein [Thalassotalea ponticola]
MKLLHTSVLPIALLALTACQEATNTSAPAESAPLIGSVWNLVELAGNPESTGDEGKTIFVEFNQEDQRYFGFAGCNNYQGKYSIDGSDIDFGIAAATKKMCQQGMQQEDALFVALDQTTNYQITGSTLTLSDASGQTLAVFRVAANN